MKYKVGDKVVLDLNKEELGTIAKCNKQIAYEILLCYTSKYMTITEAEDWGEPFGIQYSVDIDNGRTVWNEEDLKLYTEGEN